MLGRYEGCIRSQGAVVRVQNIIREPLCKSVKMPAYVISTGGRNFLISMSCKTSLSARCDRQRTFARGPRFILQ